MKEKPSITLRTQQGEKELFFQPGGSLRDILMAEGISVRSACGGHAQCGQCNIRVIDNGAMPFTSAEKLKLTQDQLDSGYRLACQIFPNKSLVVDLDALENNKAGRPLRADEYGNVCPVALRSSGMRYGVAIDLGTTHIRLTLWDLNRLERLEGCLLLNPQIGYGADVLSRLMEAAHSGDIALKMREWVESAIGSALFAMTSRSSIQPSDIGDVLIVGNTAMMSLLSGKNLSVLLQPEYWRQRLDVQPDDTTALQNAWGLGLNSCICFITPLGGFVGSDLLAGILSTRLMEQPAGSLFIDFGTNSEIALWDGQHLCVTSAAGGPAFEGSGIRCGMSAETGAIYRLISKGETAFELSVLGSGEPEGLCGSGLIDAVAWLRRQGKLDKLGRFRADLKEGFILSETDRNIVLKPGDIDLLQRAKAAIAAGVSLLCAQAGFSLSELSRVYASGAFGRLLNVSNAQQIGLLPHIPVERVHLESNAALSGCELLLLSADRSALIDGIMSVVQTYNMAEDSGFESLFIQNLYIQPMSD